jgi:hypothetical protein
MMAFLFAVITVILAFITVFIKSEYDFESSFGSGKLLELTYLVAMILTSAGTLFFLLQTIKILNICK